LHRDPPAIATTRPEKTRRRAPSQFDDRHEVIVPITAAKLDFGPWQRRVLCEWDGQRKKRVIIKAWGTEGFN